MYVVALVFFALAQPVQALAAAEPQVGVVVDSGGKTVAGVDVLLSSGMPPSGERPLIGGVMWMPSAVASPVTENSVLGRSRTDQNDGQGADIKLTGAGEQSLGVACSGFA